jgi:hypothetical protein
MPLSCKSGNDSICSIEYDADQWNELRALNAAENRLRLPCCGSRVTLKTSKLGTRFFAHRQRGECTSAAETAEHLFVKACIARAIAGTGWNVATEARGSAPDGSLWVADVMAERGKFRIAFEVQWSPQTPEVTAQRQERYRVSGVRGLWLFSRPSGIKVSKEVPSLLIEVDLDTPAAWVRVPAEESGYMTDHSARKAEFLWSQKIELDRFVRGCLSRKFVWAPGLNEYVPLDVWTAEQNCWKCNKPTSIITRLNFRVDRLLPGAKPVSLRLEDFDTPAGNALLSNALKHADLRAQGIGEIRSRFSRTRGSAYLSNGCVHCDALQGAFYEHEVWHDAEPTLTVECMMSEALFTDDVHETPLRWTFDESFAVP